MTRGRKKDLTIPPTRALIQQRDYRAKRAHYVASLEDRCRRVEEENAHLREELAAVKAGIGAVPSIPRNHETATATLQLMHHLSLTAASLAQFQQVAFPEHQSSGVATPSYTSQSSVSSVSPNMSLTPTPPTSSRSMVTNEDPSCPTFSDSEDAAEARSRSISPESECCGGILDCRDLIEPEPSLTRTSGLRSTSATSFGCNKRPY